ncbi:mediator of RNA polymerase II transcription subunit 4-like [Branchiostoma floridae x Branchiostoma japonicum]
MAGAMSTKSRIVETLDDLELISRELIELLAASKQQRGSGGGDSGEEQQMLELLIEKDEALQELLKTAREQGERHKEMMELQTQAEKRDQDIRQLQKQLKEAEHILAQALYQAKEKLKSVNKANESGAGAISSEELIRYARHISASHSVAAPVNWAPGDPRRPYPQDIEMRCGILGRLSKLPMNGHTPLPEAGTPGMVMLTSQHSTAGASTAQDGMGTSQASLSWQPSADLSSSVSTSANHTGEISVEIGKKENDDDVEVMSTDSSSSSSSDSN